jgi:peroxiredoxin
MIYTRLKKLVKISSITCLAFLTLSTRGQVRDAAAKDVTLKIHLFGVYKSKVTILSLAGATVKTIVESPAIANGETALVNIPKDYLPGEFVLRFDYEEKAGSTPYPAEKQVFVSNQNLELWARPKALNHPDSTYFQKAEVENTLFRSFSTENEKRKSPILSLQNLLMTYDQRGSKFYTAGVQEFESRRHQYNEWIKQQIGVHKAAYVSNNFPFQYVMPLAWEGTEPERISFVLAHYFDEIDFTNPLLVKTTSLKDYMNKYVNIYGEMSTTIKLRDSLFTLAGKRAIEKAKSGHPLVYGWMVDYFYNGFASFDIPKGIKMLAPYLDDPRCLTTKRQAIEQRLEGMETLVPGTTAPDFTWKLGTGKTVQFHEFKTEAKYKLVLFWSADCQHCKDLMDKLYPWYLEGDTKEKMDVFAISLDETETEVPAWEKAKVKLTAFKHKRADQGIRSAEARAYYVLATPTMILVDAKTNKIFSVPNSLEQLQKALK